MSDKLERLSSLYPSRAISSEECYEVIAYNKDDDHRVCIEGELSYHDAEKLAMEQAELLKADKLRDDNGEPFDWLEIIECVGIGDTDEDHDVRVGLLYIKNGEVVHEKSLDE